MRFTKDVFRFGAALPLPRGCQPLADGGFLFLLLLLICGFISRAQSDSVIDYSADHVYKRIHYQNDFFTATDRYFTQGIQDEVIAKDFKRSPLSKLLISLNKTSHNYYGLALEQFCFTPRSIRYDTLNTLERPFAASMYLSHFLISLDPVKKRRLTTKLSLGMIGPCAQCYEEQVSIHTALDNIQPLGWENQLKNDVAINYSARMEQGILLSKYFEFTGNVNAGIGTVYTDAGAGVMLRLGFLNPYFESLGLIKKAVKNKFQGYFVFNGHAGLVGYNALLQGGIFTKDNRHVLATDKISRGLFRYSGGIVLGYKRVSVEYTLVFISPEFKSGIPHAWGHCNLNLCF